MKLKNRSAKRKNTSKTSREPDSKSTLHETVARKIAYLKRPKYWYRKGLKKALNQCIECDAYFSALVEREFNRLENAPKSCDNVHQSDYDKIIKTLMDVYKNSEYAQLANRYFTKEALGEYDGCFENAFTNTVEYGISAKKTDKTRGAHDTQGASSSSSYQIRSKILLPYLFFNYIILNEITYNELTKHYDKNTGILKNGDEKDKQSFNLIYNSPSFSKKIDQKSFDINKNRIKETLKSIDADYNKTIVVDGEIDLCDFSSKPPMISYFKREFKNIDYILERPVEIAEVNDIIKRGKLIKNFKDFIDAKSFLCLMYALSHNPEMLKKLYALNYIDFQDAHMSEEIITPCSMIEKGCLATFSLILEEDNLYLTPKLKNYIIYQKEKRQEELISKSLLLNEDEHKFIEETLSDKELFGADLPSALVECFFPEIATREGYVASNTINDYSEKMLNLYDEYLKAESLRRECNKIAREVTNFYDLYKNS